MPAHHRCAVVLLLLVPLLAAAERQVEVHTGKGWTTKATRTLADVADLDAVPRPALDRWGGRVDRSERATGFFRVEGTAPQCTLIDPEGHPFLSLGVCSVHMSPTPGAQAALRERFTSPEGWAAGTGALLHDAGFNTLGCWSTPEPFAAVPAPATAPCLATTAMLGVATGFGKVRGLTFQASGHAGFADDLLPVFDPGWPAFCDAHIAKQVAALTKDARLLGYFSDNELPFRANALDLHAAQPAGSPARLAVERWAVKRGCDLAKPTAEDREGFFAEYVEAYFAPIAAALRRHDPNHLYLGCRFHGGDHKLQQLFRVAGRHVDVISYNLYGQWTLDRERTAAWVAWSGRPYIITEFYAKGMDSGLANTTGAGWTVKTQADRGAFYQHFTLGLLADQGCVGWHWFRYQDNDPTNTAVDPSNRDSNKGIVSNRYQPWAPLLEAMTAINREAYRLRDRSAAR